MRKRSLAILAAAAAGAVGTMSIGASGQVLYDPVVSLESQSGGTVILSTSGATTTLQVYQNTTVGDLLTSASYTNTGATGSLVNTGNSTTEAALANNPAIQNAAAAGVLPLGSPTDYVYTGGYAGSDGEATINSTANANRVVGYMAVSATSSSASLSGATIGASLASTTIYTSDNIRSAVGNDTGTNLWAGGNGSTTATAGYWYAGTGTPVSLSNAVAPTNERDVQIGQSIVASTTQNQLYGSSDTGAFVGVNIIGSGTPTSNSPAAPTVVSLFLSAASSSVGSPNGFLLMNNPNVADPTYTYAPTVGGTPVTVTVPYNVAYIADSGSANPGIEKFVYNPANVATNKGWSQAYVINDGVTGQEYLGLAGQLITNANSALDEVVLWATTQGAAGATAESGNSLEQFTDLLVGATVGASNDGEITLATAPTNEAFRGVALVPVPEPTMVGLLGLAGLGLLARRSKIQA